jgi:hypothetical protein
MTGTASRSASVIRAISIPRRRSRCQREPRTAAVINPRNAPDRSARSRATDHSTRATYSGSIASNVATRRLRRSSGALTCNRAPANPPSRPRGTHRINRPAWHAQTTYPTTPSTPRVSARITPLPETSRPSCAGKARQSDGRRRRATDSSDVSIVRTPANLAAQYGVPPELPGPTIRGLNGTTEDNDLQHGPVESQPFSSDGLHACVHEHYSNDRRRGRNRARLQSTSFDTEGRPPAPSPTATPRTTGLLMSSLPRPRS